MKLSNLFVLAVSVISLAGCSSINPVFHHASVVLIDSCDIQLFCQMQKTSHASKGISLSNLFPEKAKENCQNVIDTAFMTERNDSTFKLTIKKTFVDSLKYVNKTYKTYLITMKNNRENQVEMMNGYALKSEYPISYQPREKRNKMITVWTMRKK